MPESPICVLAVAPYDALRVSLERLAAASFPQVSLTAVTADLEEGVAAVKSAAAEYDCIISRGGTAQLIRGVTDVPVVDIGVSVYDVLRAIHLAESYTDKYAIVGFPNITGPAHILCDLLRYDVDILTVRSRAEVGHTLSRLREGGYRMVICDESSHRLARGMDFDAILITSGEESLQTAIDRAVQFGQGFRALREENFFLREGLREGSRVAVLTDTGELYFSFPSRPSDTALGVLRKRLPEAARTPVSFCHSENGVFYSVTSRRISLGERDFTLFDFRETIIPVKPSRAGLRFLSRRECELLNEGGRPGGIYGALSKELGPAAATRQSVMLVGEPGTGKDKLARSLYLRSPLRDRPFAAVDCKLMNQKSWDFLLNNYNSPLNAPSGTMYFEHMESLPADTAAALLSAMRETGLDRRIKLIFECNSPDGAPVPEICRPFAETLGVLLFRIPALRTRPDEIPPLANLCLSDLNMELGLQISGFEPRAMERLRGYSWPHNYSQFERVLRQLAVSASSTYISAAAVTELLARERSLWEPESPAAPIQDRTLEEQTAEIIRRTLAAHNGNRTAAAKALGISRATLWRSLTRDTEK